LVTSFASAILFGTRNAAMPLRGRYWEISRLMPDIGEMKRLTQSRHLLLCRLRYTERHRRATLVSA
jgi:hypothetical protein